MRRKVFLLSSVLMIWAFAANSVTAQELPPIFRNTPKQIVTAKTLAEFPVNTFLENIIVDKSGNLFVTSLEDGTIYRLSPGGERAEFAKIKGKIAGLAFDSKNNLLVTGWADGKTPSVFQISPSGTVSTLATLNDAIFLNGIEPLKDDRFLIADSYKGVIWEFDAKAKTAQIWLSDELLTRSDVKNPFPAVNGLKIYRNALYATNTERRQIVRIPLLKNGKAGKPEIFVRDVNLDDFAFDEQGNLYATTHVYNSVVRVAPSGSVTTIAELEQGVAGSTALAFGRAKDDQTQVYVVTNGGMSFPPLGGVQSAKVVKLAVGKKGLTK